MNEDQRAVLARVVVDPDAWYAHAVAHFGQELADKHLAAKVAKWTERVASSVKTRAVREHEEEQARQAMHTK